MNIKDAIEEDLERLRLSFNIPSLGKLYTSYERIDGVRKRFEYLNNLNKNANNKETKTNV